MGTHQIRFADKDLDHNSIISKLIRSEPLIKLAQNYLNSKNISVINEMVISLPTKKTLKLMYSNKVVKLFIETWFQRIFLKPLFFDLILIKMMVHMSI